MVVAARGQRMADGGRVTLRGTRPFILLISRSSSADRNRMPLLNARPLCLATSPLIERARPSLELLLPHSPILPSYWKVDPDAVAYQPRPAIKLCLRSVGGRKLWKLPRFAYHLFS